MSLHNASSNGVLSTALRWATSVAAGRGDEFYANNPADYDTVASGFLGRQEVATSIRRLVDSADHGSSLAVDNACGTGIVTSAMVGCTDRIVGRDICPEALAIASSKDGSIEVQQGDLHDLSTFGPGEVDVFTMAFSNRYVQQPAQFFAGLSQVMAPDAVGVITTSGARRNMQKVLRNASRAGLSTAVVNPRLRSWFNRLVQTKHIVLRHAQA